MSRTTFNFHDLAGVHISSTDPDAVRFFAEEYRSSKNSFSNKMKIVNLQWSKNLALRGSSSDYTFHVHKVLARWSYRIELQENRINIDALGNTTAIPMVHHMMVHPSLRYLCAQSDALMLHGSAVVVNDQSLVFTGMGGAGKTTISSLLLRHGGTDWKLHADDYTFLSKGPKSYSYMTRSHLYRDHLRWVPTIKSILTPLERFRLEFFGYLRQFSRDGIKWPVRVDAARLWPNHTISPKAALAGIIILGRKRSNSPTLKKLTPTDEIIDELMQMNFFEARHFIELIRRSFKDQEHHNWLEEWKQKERSLMEQILQETSLFQLDLPFIERDNDQFGNELVEVLLPIVGSKDSHG